MMIIPIETPNHLADALILVLDEDNVARMREADPAEVILRQAGKTLVNPTVLVCLEPPTPELTRLLHAGDVMAVIRHLQRGWKYRPERGDHDRGPESLRDSN